MADTIRVYAVPGKLVSHPARRNQYVGYKQAAGPAAESADVRVRGGLSYNLSDGGERVENSYRIRLAVRKGNLVTSRPMLAAPKRSKKNAEAGKEG